MQKKAMLHGIPRVEWERRFKAVLVAKAGLDEAADAGIIDAELESWPEKDDPPVPGFEPDWVTELPEAAAAENLSNWTN